MARPTSLLGDVRGIGRDFAVDGIPRGFVWDMIDYIPNRRGAKLEGRGPWSYLTSGAALAGEIWGGKHAPFSAGAKLLVCGGPNIYDHPTVDPGVPTNIGTMFATGLANGVMLRDRCYFADGQGIQKPKYVTYNGTTFTIAQLGASAPKAKLVEVYKDRLIGTADPANPQRVSFSPLEIDGGPPGTWDAISYVDTSRPITAFAPMGAQILAFHAKSIEKIRGSIPPGANLDTDMFIDPFSDQLGCEDPASVVNWQENVIFANSRGVHLTDGATIRSLTDQGSMGDFYRALYGRKKAGTQVVAGIFLDYLFVTILTNFTIETLPDELPITMVCDLNERTWFRVGNVYSTCYIESEAAGEETFIGLTGDRKIIKMSPMWIGNLELPEGPLPAPPYVDAVDGNGHPVLPIIDLGWKRLGPEAVKRMRHVYVSHQTQTTDTTPPPMLQVEYRMNPGVAGYGFQTAGQLPASLTYSRQRVEIGRRGYGVHLRVRQIAPSWLSRLFDIQVDEWQQDGGKL